MPSPAGWPRTTTAPSSTASADDFTHRRTATIHLAREFGSLWATGRSIAYRPGTLPLRRDVPDRQIIHNRSERKAGMGIPLTEPRNKFARSRRRDFVIARLRVPSRSAAARSKAAELSTRRGSCITSGRKSDARRGGTVDNPRQVCTGNPGTGPRRCVGGKYIVVFDRARRSG